MIRNLKSWRGLLVVAGLGAGLALAHAVTAQTPPRRTALNPLSTTLTTTTTTVVGPVTALAPDLRRPPVRDPFRPPTRSPFRP